MNARLNRFTILMLVLGSLAASGPARADTPTATSNPPQTQQSQEHKDILAWQRVGNPATQEA